MGLTSSFVALGDGTLPSSFEGLKSHLPAEWVEACLANNGVATLRKRKLPVEEVVWLVIGMALYRDRPILEVVQRLNLVLPGENGEKRTIAKGAITPARDRVGYEPLRDLFRATGSHWGVEAAQRQAWHGLKIFGIDGVTLRVPDSAENRQEFELHSGSSYPVVRATALMALRSRLLVDFCFSGCRTGEVTLAKDLLPSIPDNSLTILDRLYHNFPFWQDIRSGGQERHWLVRVRKDLRWTVIKTLGRGDELVEIRVSESSRARNPGLPEIIRARAIRYRKPGFRTRTLLTSLLDWQAFPAAEIAALYHERWELELAYNEIKTGTLERLEAIRSHSPDRVRQELWGIVIAYNLVRREMETMARELGIPPSRISFRAALMLIRDLFVWAAIASPGSLPKMLKGMRLDLQHMVLPPRRFRTYPRHVKSKPRKYPRNVGHAA